MPETDRKLVSYAVLVGPDQEDPMPGCAYVIERPEAEGGPVTMDVIQIAYWYTGLIHLTGYLRATEHVQ